MNKLVINGKFKVNFNNWLVEASKNYSTADFGQFEAWGYYIQIDYMMKFLNNIPYGNSYYVEDHRVYSTEQMNELI
ncbi:MAG TPA: hypothetical protein DCR77_08540, partial [Flavobacteriaceae bacterium]|nr:hypothetical protein [Flavobacteriaceae bacterium]